MDAKSHEKVMNVGFTILRMDDYPTVRIKHKKQGSSHDWSTFENFPSKAARDRVYISHMKKLAELLENPFMITD